MTGADAIRAKSLTLTRRLIDRAREAGFRTNTPDSDAERGGTVVIDVPHGAGVADELIKRGVIVDHRPGAGIRMAPHFYNTAEEIDGAMRVLDEIVSGPRPQLGSGIPGHASGPDGSRIPDPGSRLDS